MFLARVGRPEIAIEDDLLPIRSGPNSTDGFISQALTNVLKNACEGIDAGIVRRTKAAFASSASTPTVGAITVSDNGKGFPNHDRHKLTEPYVTTRAEGTELGLPIVIKIFEDHHGEVELLDGLSGPAVAARKW